MTSDLDDSLETPRKVECNSWGCSSVAIRANEFSPRHLSKRNGNICRDSIPTVCHKSYKVGSHRLCSVCAVENSSHQSMEGF